MGVVYQAGIPCVFQVSLREVKSLARIEVSGARPIDPASASSRRVDGTIVDLKGESCPLSDVAVYNQGSFATDYAYGFGLGPAIMAACLQKAEVLSVSIGKGTYEIPMERVAVISFKDKSYLTDSGLRCPIMGKLVGVVAVAGDAPNGNGRLAMYPSTIAELRLEKVEGAPKDEAGAPEAAESLGTASCYGAGGAQPSLSLAQAQSEIYSPAIDWSGTDSVLAFRAALGDFEESGVPDQGNSGLMLEKTVTRAVLPIQVGQAYWAVPFGAIKEFGMDAKGGLSISLMDGSAMRGQPYKNWNGLVGKGSAGVARLARKKIPARVSFLEAGLGAGLGVGAIAAKDLAISCTLKESMQQVYGQSDYLDWSLSLSIENKGSAPIAFGGDILLMDCRGDDYDGAYVSYAVGSPAKDFENGDFDPEAQAYSIANFENRWNDGTMRGWRNGGTYIFGDPPDFKAEATLCNAKLAAGASLNVVKEFTQGSYIDGHDRVLVVLPCASSGSGKYRPILTFAPSGSAKGEWSLRSVQLLRMTKDDALASLRSAKGDVPLSVLALHWLTALDPAAAAPILDQNVRGSAKGLPLIASIQLLKNSGLKAGDEALTAIKAIAAGDSGWAATIAKRYLGKK